MEQVKSGGTLSILTSSAVRLKNFCIFTCAETVNTDSMATSSGNTFVNFILR